MNCNISVTEEQALESSEEAYDESPEVIPSKILVRSSQLSKNEPQKECARLENEQTISKKCNVCFILPYIFSIY